METQVITPIGGIKLGIKLGGNSPTNDTKLGGITPIPDAEHNAKIIDLARWAVDEFNKEIGKPGAVKFIKVDSASQQVVSGMMYYITLDAYTGCIMKTFEAKVWEQSWVPSKKLVEFKQISN